MAVSRTPTTSTVVTFGCSCPSADVLMASRSPLCERSTCPAVSAAVDVSLEDTAPNDAGPETARLTTPTVARSPLEIAARGYMIDLHRFVPECRCLKRRGRPRTTCTISDQDSASCWLDALATGDDFWEGQRRLRAKVPVTPRLAGVATADPTEWRSGSARPRRRTSIRRRPPAPAPGCARPPGCRSRVAPG